MSSNRLQRVLVVEDDVVVRQHLLQLLKSDGYRATGVGAIGEAFALKNLQSFHAILLDWQLPDGTAEDLHLQFRPQAPDAATIVVIGDANVEATIIALRHGAADYLVKPITSNCLQTCIARVLHLRDRREKFAQCERLATIGQAVTSVAHESRNALQRIQARVDLMEMDLANDQQKMEDLRVIKSANRSLQCLFEELRDFAAPKVLEKEHCLLGELIDRAWQSLDATPEARLASIEYDLTDIEVLVDPNSHRIC